MEILKYNPLNEKQQEIRVLVLLPGQFQDPVHAVLVNRPLLPGKTHDFEALSYVWGSVTKSATIMLASVHSDALQNLVTNHISRANKNLSAESDTVRAEFCDFTVTNNLASALVYLRYPDRIRTVWIDAICVNQQDAEERSAQVNRMSEVYVHARKVVVWLGEGDSIAFDIVEWIASKVRFDPKTRRISCLSAEAEDSHWGDENIEVPLNRAQFRSIQKLLENPWFYRLWIVQEIQHGSRNASLYTGHKSINWQVFYTAVGALLRKTFPSNLGESPSDTGKFACMVDNVMELINDLRNKTLDSILRTTANRLCSDPRDKIYAILSLCPELSIRPNYAASMDVTTVYQVATENHFRNTMTLNLLSQCGLRPGRVNTPTWVPDFSHYIPKQFRRGIIIYSLETPNVQNNRLIVRGKRVGTITSIRELGRSWSIERTVRLLKDIDVSTAYVGGGSLFEAIIRTLVTDDFAERQLPYDNFRPSDKIVEDFYTWIKDVESHTAKMKSLDYHSYRVWLTYCSTRSFFETVEGYVGLCPAYTQLGDQVVSVIGCDRPLVLRPSDTENDTYSVVGAAYCHGAMAAEAFLGPLPSTMQYMYHKGMDAWVLKCRADPTGRVIDDTRLREVPTDWEMSYHDNGVHDCSVNRVTGSGFQSPDFDPRRLDTEIEKRGVKLEQFILV